MAVYVLLISGIVAEWACCLGLLVGRNPYARLHFLGPAALLGATAFCAAVITQEGFSQSGIKAILILLCLVGGGAVVSHATARAIFARANRTRKDRSSSP